MKIRSPHDGVSASKAFEAADADTKQLHADACAYATANKCSYTDALRALAPPPTPAPRKRAPSIQSPHDAVSASKAFEAAAADTKQLHEDACNYADANKCSYFDAVKTLSSDSTPASRNLSASKESSDFPASKSRGGATGKNLPESVSFGQLMRL